MFKAKGFTRNIRPYVEAELALAHRKQNQNSQQWAFSHLENAHCSWSSLYKATR